MERIYSKRNKKRLLHIIYTAQDIENQQERGFNITPEETALQARTIKAKVGDVFPAHAHPLQKRQTTHTQESIIVIKGKVSVTYFDTDSKPIFTRTLGPGDLTITFDGGHKFEILEPALLYEHKNGPYNGKEKDKEMIDE